MLEHSKMQKAVGCKRKGRVLTDDHAVLRDDVVIVNCCQVSISSTQSHRSSRAERRARRDEVSHFEAGSSTVGDDQYHDVMVVSEQGKHKWKEGKINFETARF